jgi:hypothetical protein
MRYLGLVAAAVLLLSVTACDNENDTDAMRDAYQASLAAVNGNDGGKSYDLLSKACRDRISKEQWSQGIERAHAALGKGKLEVDTFEVVAQRGTEATVRSSARAKDAPPDLTLPSAPRESRMLKEGDDWRLDDCAG